MKFGVQITGRTGDLAGFVDWIAAKGEPAGLDSVWTAESYGWDCFTPLGYVAARTRRLRLGTGICAMPARTPASAAMSAMTLDQFSGGRMTLGLGVSGPKVADAWYGQPFGQPLKRSREYVEILRKAFRGERLTHHGEYYNIPTSGGSGEGLQTQLKPRADLPIMLAAQGPKNIALAGEIADGLITVWFNPGYSGWYLDQLAQGHGPGFQGRRPGFEIGAVVDVHVGRTFQEAAVEMRQQIAFYVARMGLPGRNFYYDAFARFGFKDDCDRVVHAYNEGGAAAGAAAVTDAMVQQHSLVGPVEKILEDLQEWDKSCLDLMILRGSAAQLSLLLDKALSGR